MWKQLANQWALVTGASSGLGEEFARQLASRGMHLVLVARRRELLEQLASELLMKHGTRCHVIVSDLTDPGEPERVLRETAAQGISIELLVNNAGFGIVGEVDQADIARILVMIQLNISATTELIYRILPGMLARGRGRDSERVVIVGVPTRCVHGGLCCQQGLRPSSQRGAAL